MTKLEPTNLYVVKAYGGKFLAGNMRQYETRGGIVYACRHSGAKLQNGGPWLTHAECIIPIQIGAQSGLPTHIGDPIPISQVTGFKK